MAALYVLGRASTNDTVSMLTGMSITSVRASVRRFCLGVVTDLHHVHVRLPVGEELKEVMAQYRRKGFPGAMGSVDVTHVYWDRVRADEQCDHVGKEGKPTLAFQAIVDFTRRVLANTHGFAGAENDNTISRNDGALEAIRGDEPYTRAKFELNGADGRRQQKQEAYLICDGGYLKVGLACSYKVTVLSLRLRCKKGRL